MEEINKRIEGIMNILNKNKNIHVSTAQKFAEVAR